MQDLNFISFADKMQIHFSKDRLSFGLTTFQSDIHFTLAFNSKSPDVNFHVSRNIGEPGTKPKSEVIRMRKEIAVQLIEDLSKFLLNHVLEPLDVEILQKENIELLRFIKDTDAQTTKFYHSVNEQFSQVIFNIAKEKRKGRFYVKDGVEEDLGKLSPDESSFIEYYFSGAKLSEVSSQVVESGTMITDKEFFSVINFYGKYYLPKNNIDIIALIKVFLKPKLSLQIMYRFKRAVVAVRNANTFNEIRHLNKPVIIVKNKQILTN